MDTTRTDTSTPYGILLALGEEADARLVSSMLEAVKSVLNFKVTRASSLREVVDLPAKHPQDAAIVALGLSGSDGLESLEILRREARGLPVIAFAREAAACSPSQAAERGAHELLVRGAFDSYLLVRAVRYAAERRRSKDALRAHLDK